jgi:hypothetical protein
MPNNTGAKMKDALTNRMLSTTNPEIVVPAKATK